MGFGIGLHTPKKVPANPFPIRVINFNAFTVQPRKQHGLQAIAGDAILIFANEIAHVVAVRRVTTTGYLLFNKCPQIGWQ
ncbi:MAG TPA: hypothetical protein VH370_12330 [Humisphaera sp.]|nr:hypothetical protein [Humisphaera sp.]